MRCCGSGGKNDQNSEGGTPGPRGSLPSLSKIIFESEAPRRRGHGVEAWPMFDNVSARATGICAQFGSCTPEAMASVSTDRIACRECRSPSRMNGMNQLTHGCDSLKVDEDLARAIVRELTEPCARGH